MSEKGGEGRGRHRRRRRGGRGREWCECGKWAVKTGMDRETIELKTFYVAILLRAAVRKVSAIFFGQFSFFSEGKLIKAGSVIGHLLLIANTSRDSAQC
jgi:hypothetical protein